MHLSNVGNDRNARNNSLLAGAEMEKELIQDAVGLGHQDALQLHTHGVLCDKDTRAFTAPTHTCIHTHTHTLNLLFSTKNLYFYIYTFFRHVLASKQ